MPVTGWVGLPGSGKTLRLVQRTMEARAEGRDVFANFRLGYRIDGYLVPTCGPIDTICAGWHHRSHGHPTQYQFRPRTPDLDVMAQLRGWRRGHGFVADPGATLLESWEQVMAVRVARDVLGAAHKLQLVRDDTAEGGWRADPACKVWNCRGCSSGITIALDELNLWAPSRFWQDIGMGVLNRWAYVRKDGLEVLWTAQHEARIDKVAREVTDYIWSCRSFGGVIRIAGRWSLHLQLFHRRRWMPMMMTEKNRVAEGEGAHAVGIMGMDFEMAFWPSLAAAARSYDTYEHVAAVAVRAEEAKPKRARLRAVK